jgi:Uma2 family endonuclease
MTPSEYLAWERQAETRHEFVNGDIIARAGASEAHNLIVGNMSGELRARLRGRGCKTYPSDMKVKVAQLDTYTYPDVVVVCSQPHFEDQHVDTLLNPTLIVEVLSPSTEAYDRGEKFAHYRQIPSLQEFVLIAQDRVRVERYVRQQGEQWLLTEFSDPAGGLPLVSVSCELPLAEIYYQVGLPVPPTGQPPAS